MLLKHKIEKPRGTISWKTTVCVSSFPKSCHHIDVAGFGTTVPVQALKPLFTNCVRQIDLELLFVKK